MKLFLTILVLIFSLQSWTKADDVSELEIEGMSIGDSLLDFMDKSAMDFQFLYKKKIYMTTYFDNPKIYEDIQITVKSDDNNYIIHNITGKIYYKKDYYKCLQNKVEITQAFQSLMDSNVKKKK